MTQRPRKSKERQSAFASDFADDFETDAVHNAVYEDVLQDEQLARLLDAAALADEAVDLRTAQLGDDGDLITSVEEAEGALGWIARQRALETVAEACVTVITDGDDWVAEGHWEQETIDEATDEAREWLQTHTNEATRVGALEVL